MMHDSAIATRIYRQIASDIQASPAQVAAAVGLLDGGATVPFIARYRKEATQGLDDTQLRGLEERLGYLRELEDRRGRILENIEAQGKLTVALKAAIVQAETKARLEDLFLPYKTKRRTKAAMAREAGLAPLAEALLKYPDAVPERVARDYVDGTQVVDADAALSGARAIVIEGWCENADLLEKLRQWFLSKAQIQTTVVKGKSAEAGNFRDYFDHTESLQRVASHRLLAMLRGKRDGLLSLSVLPGLDEAVGTAQAIGMVAGHAGVQSRGRPGDAWLLDTCRLAWQTKLLPALTTELINGAREAAEKKAVEVFSDNLSDLLLASPAGPKCVLGIDPGIRTGCKVAVVDVTGKLLETENLYPHEPRRQWEAALSRLEQLVVKHQVRLIAIGNGTASRETDRLVAELLRKPTLQGVTKTLVSEAGASVYSASALAAAEFPQLDVSLRGAVSIARRLQDPLAELVKIDPKAIGVGQYQHDVDQVNLAKALDARVEDCVNAVGVAVNSASVALLSRVSGISSSVASNIVQYRNEHGPFRRRRELLKVARLGERCFEQCAGFLRIQDGESALDASAVHPEAYPLVERMAAATGKSVHALIGDTVTLKGLDLSRFIDDRFGLPTIRDIVSELEKPGRDPRPAFESARFAEGIETLADLREGMVLDGVVSNVAAFGAFVDIGVHQDGLVHISQLAEGFVKDPRTVVKAGQIIKVRVVEVDVARKRIALSCRLNPDSDRAGDIRPAPNMPVKHDVVKNPTVSPRDQPAGAMADAFARAKR